MGRIKAAPRAYGQARGPGGRVLGIAAEIGKGSAGLPLRHLGLGGHFCLQLTSGFAMADSACFRSMRIHIAGARHGQGLTEAGHGTGPHGARRSPSDRIWSHCSPRATHAAGSRQQQAQYSQCNRLSPRAGRKSRRSLSGASTCQALILVVGAKAAPTGRGGGLRAAGRPGLAGDSPVKTGA